jgi:Zn ribbon nucleic-acid-binding protein
MSTNTNERLTVGECMACGKQGSTPLYNVNGAAVSECDACHAARLDAERAERERRLLEEWGTLRDRRTA